MLGLKFFIGQSAFVLQNHEITNAVVILQNPPKRNYVLIVKFVKPGDPVYIYGDLVAQYPYGYEEDDKSWKEGRNPGILIHPDKLSDSDMAHRKKLAAQFMTMANNCRKLASFFMKEWLSERKETVKEPSAV